VIPEMMEEGLVRSTGSHWSIVSTIARTFPTLHDWRDEIATMWRFTRNNGITEGFHTKMKLLQRQAFGLRNFENYRLRVKVLCS
jgi:transposase